MTDMGIESIFKVQWMKHDGFHRVVRVDHKPSLLRPDKRRHV